MHTESITCSKYLQEIGVSTQLYANDYNDILPPPSGDGTKRWAGYINPYLSPASTGKFGFPNRLLCPSYEGGSVYWYGLNYKYSNVNLNTLMRLSSTIMIGDTGASFYLYPNRWRRTYKFRHFGEFPKADHNREISLTGIMNTLQGDLHVQQYRWEDKEITTPHEQCRALNP